MSMLLELWSPSHPKQLKPTLAQVNMPHSLGWRLKMQQSAIDLI